MYEFSLGGDQGLGILASGYPASQAATCDSSATLAAMEGTETSGNSGLTYDANTGMYTYNWKTEKGWAGTCRRLTIRLIDGVDRSVNFSFTK